MAEVVLGGHVELVELAVLPEALLQTYDDDTPARRQYLREGFQRLVASTHGDVVLVKELR